MHLDPETAIAELYAAFARPAPRAVEGCPCCITPAELDALVRTPLRALSPAQLESYASSVMLTVGSAEDLRYFWPRLVELSFRDELLTNREIVLAKPRLAEWESWPANEQRATRQFAAAVLGDMATRPYERSDVDDWICGFGRMLEDVTPYLDPLLAETPAAEANLLGFHSWNARDLARGRLANAFCRDEPQAEARVVAWLRRPDVAAAIARAYQRQSLDPDES